MFRETTMKWIVSDILSRYRQTIKLLKPHLRKWSEQLSITVWTDWSRSSHMVLRLLLGVVADISRLSWIQILALIILYICWIFLLSPLTKLVTSGEGGGGFGSGFHSGGGLGGWRWEHSAHPRWEPDGCWRREVVGLRLSQFYFTDKITKLKLAGRFE